MKLSRLAENFPASQIVEISKRIKQMKREGKQIYDQTVGDFDPSIFPMPEALKQEIIAAYKANFSNYPEPRGNIKLRSAIKDFMSSRLGLHYDEQEILVGAGGRPLIYALYRILIDPGDFVVYGAPSWSNYHYSEILGAQQRRILTGHSTNFLLDANLIRKEIKGATLLALCSPINPSGAIVSEDDLRKICELVLEENAARPANAKKLYVLYDEVYNELIYGGNKHFTPVSLVPAMKAFTILVDAFSKSFAATGMRVGWCCGPKEILDRMEGLLTHTGGWAPNPEQHGCANFLGMQAEIDTYLSSMRAKLLGRQGRIFKGVKAIAEMGYDIEIVEPKGSIYLAIKFNLDGKRTTSGEVLRSENDVTNYLLSEARLGLVPFTAFGGQEGSYWYRLSVGTTRDEDLDAMIEALRNAIQKLK